MIQFKTIPSFRKQLEILLKVKRGVYGSVHKDIISAIIDKDIETIRNNRDMILIYGDLNIVKLRIPDSKQKLSKRDGFRLIYVVSRTAEIVVFLDIYPKNGPKQQLDISTEKIKRLLREFLTETESGLRDFCEFN